MATSGSLTRRIHRRHSAQSVAVSLASRFVVKNLVRAWAIRPDLAWPLASVDRLAGMVPHRQIARVERFRLGYCVAEQIQAAGVSTERAILYLHGGAFLTCGLNTHRSLVTRLSRAADASVLNIDYRMLPAHRIADAVDDGLSGLRWLLRRGYHPEQIVIAGDSAGGYLAFMTALAAAQSDLMKPAGIATVSPFTDADPTAKLQHRNARRCAMFPCEALMAFTRYLLRARAASPMDADLSLLPPVAIHASTDELLLPDAEAMAQRLDAAGVRCDLHLWEGQVHDFPLAADVLPEGRRAIRYLGDFVKDITAPPKPGTAAA
ncbi:alpha/beta hydrolase [Mycolicibacter virginiensis]|uniref:alpha/beta hydrolase n=1 Tax=Mycolicibacter virginiensis TaxID=1795032 RepID=UPI001F03D2E8|nr:alpha/beta hydrolase [Mycolicibacter virginiensis]ULP46532.1 alpha/beta hydrolase [Mycolicibacter virginiensis]